MIPGARRSFADAKEEGEKKEEGKKEAPPKAGPGFWATFKKSYNEAFSKKAAEDAKLAEAQQTLDKGKEDAAVAAGKAFEAAKRAAEEAKKRADVIDEKTRPAREAVSQQVGKGMGVVGRVANKVGENPVVKATAEAMMTGTEKILNVPDAIDKAGEAVEKKLKDSSLGRAVNKTIGGEAPMGRVEGKEIDSETMGLAIREETGWERRMRKIRESTFMGPLVQTVETIAEVATDASDRVGDRVFGENETSLCIAEIKRDDPWFNMQSFLDKLEGETIPFVLKAFLEDRYEDLQTICTERSLSLLGHLIKERKEKGLKADPHILDLEDVALMEARMVDGEPILLVTFSAQQVHCVRNKKGEIVDGHESKIQQIFYVWAMVRHFPEDPGTPPSWKLHEMAIQHQMELLT